MTHDENLATDVPMFSQPSPKKAKIMSSGDVSEAMVLKFKKISENAQPPRYGSAGAAGADLCSAEECVIPAKGKYLVSTGLQMAVPIGYYGRVAPRSGLAVKNFIDVGAGVVDNDYRGEVKVLLFNFGDEDFTVKVGDRIAQFICEKYSRFSLEEVDSLEETVRGAGGFGSTGVSNQIPDSEKTA